MSGRSGFSKLDSIASSSYQAEEDGSVHSPADEEGEGAAPPPRPQTPFAAPEVQRTAALEAPEAAAAPPHLALDLRQSQRRRSTTDVAGAAARLREGGAPPALRRAGSHGAELWGISAPVTYDDLLKMPQRSYRWTLS